MSMQLQQESHISFFASSSVGEQQGCCWCIDTCMYTWSSWCKTSGMLLLEGTHIHTTRLWCLPISWKSHVVKAWMKPSSSNLCWPASWGCQWQLVIHPLQVDELLVSDMACIRHAVGRMYRCARCIILTVATAVAAQRAAAWTELIKKIHRRFMFELCYSSWSLGSIPQHVYTWVTAIAFVPGGVPSAKVLYLSV